MLWKQSIHIAVVSCGDRLEESLVMIKSAVLFSRSHLIFHIFTEPEQRKTIEEQVNVDKIKENIYIGYKKYPQTMLEISISIV